MSDLSIARDIALICIAAFFGGSIARKLKLPLVVGYILAGMLLSGFLKNLIHDPTNLSQLSNFGVALLLFSLGLEFSFQRLTHLKDIAIKGVLLQIILTIFIFICLGPLLKFSLYEALFFGSVISMSSTAIVIKILADKGETETQSGEITINWLLLQDLSVILLSLILPSLTFFYKYQPQRFLGELSQLLLGLIKTALIIYLILLTGKKIIPKISTLMKLQANMKKKYYL